MQALLADRDNDAVLAMHVPTALSQPRDTAAAVVRALEEQAGSGARKPALAVWMGGDVQATSTLNAAGVPTYASEAEAVRGFMYLVRHREAQQALMETPPSLPQRSEEHTSELQSLMRISYAVFCLKKKKLRNTN